MGQGIGGCGHANEEQDRPCIATDMDRPTFGGSRSDGPSLRIPIAGTGILGAIIGSAFTLIVTLVLAFPIGVMSAVYLEEFAKNRWTDLIEVNINNLAAVPSIVFGLLGLAVFLNFFAVLALWRAGAGLDDIAHHYHLLDGGTALGPRGGLGVGASSMQTVLHHVVPLAMPGMLTGAIIGMAGGAASHDRHGRLHRRFAEDL